MEDESGTQRAASVLASLALPSTTDLSAACNQEAVYAFGGKAVLWGERIPVLVLACACAAEAGVLRTHPGRARATLFLDRHSERARLRLGAKSTRGREVGLRFAFRSTRSPTVSPNSIFRSTFWPPSSFTYKLVQISQSGSSKANRRRSNHSVIAACKRAAGALAGRSGCSKETSEPSRGGRSRRSFSITLNAA